MVKDALIVFCCLAVVVEGYFSFAVVIGRVCGLTGWKGKNYE